MLFVKISAARSDWSSTETPEVCAGRSRLGDRLVLTRHETARRPGIAPGPVAREQRRQREAHDRDEQQRGPLADAPPVAVRRELAQRVARAGRVVHRVAAALGEPFEPGDDRIGRESGAARTRGRPRPRGSTRRAAARRRARGARASCRSARRAVRARSTSAFARARTRLGWSCAPRRPRDDRDAGGRLARARARRCRFPLRRPPPRHGDPDRDHHRARDRRRTSHRRPASCAQSYAC